MVKALTITSTYTAFTRWLHISGMTRILGRHLYFSVLWLDGRWIALDRRYICGLNLNLQIYNFLSFPQPSSCLPCCSYPLYCQVSNLTKLTWQPGYGHQQQIGLSDLIARKTATAWQIYNLTIETLQIFSTNKYTFHQFFLFVWLVK